MKRYGKAFRNVSPQDTANIGQSGIVFDHIGFEGDQRAKHERNISLLIKELKKDPGKIWHRQHLAHCYYELGRKTEAEALWRENIRRLRERADLSLLDILSYVALIQHMLDDGRDVRSLLSEAIALFHESPYLTWLQGRVLMSQRWFEEAIPHFERLIRWGREKNYDRSISYENRIFGAHAYEAMALCHFRRSRYRESERYFEIARTCVTNSVEYRLKSQLCAILEEKQSRNSAGH
jgi:tetratricopeptide (TPR) repeat protein